MLPHHLLWHHLGDSHGFFRVKMHGSSVLGGLTERPAKQSLLIWVNCYHLMTLSPSKEHSPKWTRVITHCPHLKPFESLWVKLPDSGHLLSHMCKLVLSEQPVSTPYYIRGWERELGLEFTPPQIQKMIQLVHTTFIRTHTQESSYKFLIRWYRTPSHEAHA